MTTPEELKKEFEDKFPLHTQFCENKLATRRIELWSWFQSKLSQERWKTLKEVRTKITQLAQEGRNVQDEWKGSVLYSSFMIWLSSLTKRK